MNDDTCIYAIHIAATPEQVWQGLTDNEFLKRYWEEWRMESDWKPGSTLAFYQKDGTLYSTGRVIESDPPNRLVYTWPEKDDDRDEEEHERLTWEITRSGPDTVMLKLIHERLREEYVEGVRKGWPMVLSSLKSLLETGRPLFLDDVNNPIE